jgi:anthranilate synthase component 1
MTRADDANQNPPAGAADAASLTRSGFRAAARSVLADETARTPGVTPHLPIGIRLLADQLTPVVAYRRMVAQDERTAPSFLFESVEAGAHAGRYSLLGVEPTRQLVAARGSLTDTARGNDAEPCEDPLAALSEASRGDTLATVPTEHRRHELPGVFLGGWVGFAAYDTVRYTESERLSPHFAPPDDRDLPELHFAFYPSVVVFDNVTKLVHAVTLIALDPSHTDDQLDALYDDALARLRRITDRLRAHTEPMTTGLFTPPERADASRGLPPGVTSNTTRERFLEIVERAREYIAAGDIFQVVLGQRLERLSHADPFDVYRALRVVNPSPYMVYLQAAGAILIASSPEILCRVTRSPGGERIVTNRPLAGTRPRGATEHDDRALEADLRADAKETAEHVMLVDLARNDVGRVALPSSIELSSVLDVERYSHVMHLSSTVIGTLRDNADAWDALRAALPVGTVSGAPKIRAMQIIDELEAARRGPYAGGFGYVGLDGQMEMALALRTIVTPLSAHDEASGAWTYHLQASAGVVHDSVPEAEYAETLNKAAALSAAITSAERSLSDAGGGRDR